VLWKNDDAPAVLSFDPPSQPSLQSAGNSVFAWGGDVYVAGMHNRNHGVENGWAVLWKNSDAPIFLSSAGNNATANCVFVK
jgi:hypothetical protein